MIDLWIPYILYGNEVQKPKDNIDYFNDGSRIGFNTYITEEYIKERVKYVDGINLKGIKNCNNYHRRDQHIYGQWEY